MTEKNDAELLELLSVDAKKELDRRDLQTFERLQRFVLTELDHQARKLRRIAENQERLLSRMDGAEGDALLAKRDIEKLAAFRTETQEAFRDHQKWQGEANEEIRLISKTASDLWQRFESMEADKTMPYTDDEPAKNGPLLDAAAALNDIAERIREEAGGDPVSPNTIGRASANIRAAVQLLERDPPYLDQARAELSAAADRLEGIVG